MNVIPTVAIGIGQGGSKVVKALSDMVQNYEGGDMFRFIAIDSSSDDLRKNITDVINTNTVPIIEKGFDISTLKEYCPYLYDGIEVKREGALRDRVYGRFLYDLNSARVRKTVNNVFSDILDEWRKEQGGGKPPGHMMIWVIHSLGGGTGSGAFPSLIVQINQLADDVFLKGNSGITPHICCVGILPSGSNIADISFAEYDKRYLANSYAALAELNKLAYPPKGLKLQPFGLNKNHRSEIPIEKRPFERYFLFGIDEEKTSKLKDDAALEVMDYVTNGNLVIANMIYALPQYQKGLENLWREVKSPFVTFGESELYIPLTQIREVARENDLLGPRVKGNEEIKSRILTEVASISKISADSLNEKTLEQQVVTVRDTFRLRGLLYFLGKLQLEFENQVRSNQVQLEEELSRVWDQLQELDWAKGSISAVRGSGIDDRFSIIKRVMGERITHLREMSEKIRNVLSKPKLLERARSIESKKEQLQEMKNRLEKLRTLKVYIDEQIGKDLHDPALPDIYGTARIRESIIFRENRLLNKKRNLSQWGSGRVIKFALPLEVLDKVSLMHPEINVSGMKSLSDMLAKFSISDDTFIQLIQKRISQAQSRDLKVSIGPRESGSGDLPEEQLFILSNTGNESGLSKAENAWHHLVPERIITDDFSMEHIVFINFSLRHELDDILEYSMRRDEYRNGVLQDTTDIVESIGTIFAHPEWFPEDENVRKVFPKLYPES